MGSDPAVGCYYINRHLFFTQMKSLFQNIASVVIVAVKLIFKKK